jgi:hypothetical protein
MDVISKDKIIDINENDVVEGEVEELIEELPINEKVVTEPRTVPKNIQLTDFEFSALSKTFSTIQRLKEVLKENPHQATADQINFLEASIWDDVVKKFGWASMEAAQSDGYLFTIKTVHVVECYKKEA